MIHPNKPLTNNTRKLITAPSTLNLCVNKPKAVSKATIHIANTGVLVPASCDCSLGNTLAVSVLIFFPFKVPPPIPSLKKSGRRSEEHTSELQSHVNLVCRLLLE